METGALQTSEPTPQNDALPKVKGLVVRGTNTVRDAIIEIRKCADERSGIDIYQVAAFRWVCVYISHISGSLLKV